MSIQVIAEEGGELLHVVLGGKLHKEDYQAFAPEVDRLVQEHGKLSILLELHDFHGWDAGALWEDLKFDVKHFSDIKRLAIIGETRWEKGMAVFCKPFTTAKVRFFESRQLDVAREWVRESLTAEA